MEDLKTEISEFILSTLRNKWIYFNDGKVYLRKSKRLLDNKLVNCFDIASIEINTPSKGIGSKVINLIHQLHPYEMTFIESILNTRFYDYLIKEGWQEYGEINDITKRHENLFKLK